MSRCWSSSLILNSTDSQLLLEVCNVPTDNLNPQENDQSWSEEVTHHIVQKEISSKAVFTFSIRYYKQLCTDHILWWYYLITGIHWEVIRFLMEEMFLLERVTLSDSLKIMLAVIQRLCAQRVPSFWSPVHLLRIGTPKTQSISRDTHAEQNEVALIRHSLPP